MLGTAVLVERHVRRVDAAATAKSAGSASRSAARSAETAPFSAARGAKTATFPSAASASETNVPRGFRRRALEHHPVPRLEPVKHLAIHLFGGEELGEGFGGVRVHPQRGGAPRGVRVTGVFGGVAVGQVAEKRSPVELSAFLQTLGLGEHLRASLGFDAIEHGPDGFGEERASVSSGRGGRGG